MYARALVQSLLDKSEINSANEDMENVVDTRSLSGLTALLRVERVARDPESMFQYLVEYHLDDVKRWLQSSIGRSVPS